MSEPAVPVRPNVTRYEAPTHQVALRVRDDDKDGKPEICARVAFGIGIGGLCIEMPVVIRP